MHLARVYWRCQTKFDVLEMGRNYSGWFVKYHVDLVHDPPIPIPDLLQWEKRTVLLFLAPDLNENGGGGEECSSLCILLVRSSLIISRTRPSNLSS